MQKYYLLRIASPTLIPMSKPLLPQIKVDRVGYAPTPGDFQSPASTKLASDPKLERCRNIARTKANELLDRFYG